jgi:hypothetical protein
VRRRSALVTAADEPPIDHDAPVEFRLLAACCRWPLDEVKVAELAAPTAIDWSLFVRMARRHRVEALASRALARSRAPIPAADAAELTAAANRVAGENLALAAETARLCGALAQAKIPFLFVKGLSLGMLAYGTILLKGGWDIDLLVDRRELAATGGLLQHLGYRMTVPAGEPTPARLGAWHERLKESLWQHPTRRVSIELHTGLVDNARLLPKIDVHAPRQTVEVLPGAAVPTLAKDELFAYLTVHGASSAWFRLKWLADLAALLAHDDAAEIERLYRRAQALGAGRAPALALLLCRDLFGTALSPALAAELRDDRMNRWLVRGAWRSLAGRAVATEITRLRGGTLWMHLMQLGLAPGLGFKLEELRRQLRLKRLRPHAGTAG